MHQIESCLATTPSVLQIESDSGQTQVCIELNFFASNKVAVPDVHLIESWWLVCIK